MDQILNHAIILQRQKWIKKRASFRPIWKVPDPEYLFIVDKKLLGLGFGANIGGVVSHCFPLNGDSR